MMEMSLPNDVCDLSVQEENLLLETIKNVNMCKNKTSELLETKRKLVEIQKGKLKKLVNLLKESSPKQFTNQSQSRRDIKHLEQNTLGGSSSSSPIVKISDLSNIKFIFKPLQEHGKIKIYPTLENQISNASPKTMRDQVLDMKPPILDEPSTLNMTVASRSHIKSESQDTPVRILSLNGSLNEEARDIESSLTRENKVLPDKENIVLLNQELNLPSLDIKNETISPVKELIVPKIKIKVNGKNSTVSESCENGTFKKPKSVKTKSSLYSRSVTAAKPKPLKAPHLRTQPDFPALTSTKNEICKNEDDVATIPEVYSSHVNESIFVSSEEYFNNTVDALMESLANRTCSKKDDGQKSHSPPFGKQAFSLKELKCKNCEFFTYKLGAFKRHQLLH